MQLTVRKGTLADLVKELEEQQARKVDMVVPARDLWSHHGLAVVRNGAQTVTTDGVTSSNLFLTPSSVWDDGLAAKLSPVGRPFGRKYLRGLRETGRVDLVDANVNGLLHGNKDLGIPADDRAFFVRTFSPADETKTGYARALLSNSYRPIDNWDVLGTILSGLKAAGFTGHVIRQADLTDDKMYVRISVPEVSALAPTLLRGYTSPYSGAKGADNPVVEAGLVITNSETGGGAFTITPELVIQICTNGMTIKQDMIRKAHLGGKLDEGVIKVSDDTRRKNLELIASQTRDAVNTFLDPAYVERVIARIENQSEAPVDDVNKALETVISRPAFTKDDMSGLLSAFFDGGDRTRGGLANAITAYSQRVDDADRAYEMDADAFAAAGFVGVTGKAA